jgi:hypothetical protein
MRLIPRINPAITFRLQPFDVSIFNYPKWTQQIPIETSKWEFQSAWYDLFNAIYQDCKVEYGEQKLMGNALGAGLSIYTPNKAIMIGSFGVFTDEPVLSEEQTFYYEGAGCTWGIDLIGQRFWRIDPATMLPVDWTEAQNWEIIKRYKPFMDGLNNNYKLG